MAATSPGHVGSAAHSGLAGGVTLFAGTALATVGFFQFFEGLSAVLSDSVYVSTRAYTYQFDITTWGWIHLIMGVTAVLVGIGTLLDRDLAYIMGVMIAALSALTNFLFIPWYPVWAIVIIAFDVAVIWALCVRLNEHRPGDDVA
jgi:hypothetical protein